MADLDIAAFLRARYDEQEIHAQIAGPGEVAWATFLRDDGTLAYTSVVSRNGDKWVTNGQVVEPVGTTVIFDQALVLADVAAKRQVLAMHERDVYSWGGVNRAYCRKCAVGDSCDECLDYETQVWPCSTLSLLALPYAGHPDYREEWKL